MRLLTGVVLLMVLAGTAAGGSRQRQCVQGCGGLIAVCTRDATERGFGDLRRVESATVARR
jgi:hypothetical protein